MCIAILKPVGKSLSRELLYNCYTSNPDGCGFAYATGDDVIIHKFMKFDDFYNEYQKYDGKYTMLIHFRIATHGAIELDNCHPFVLNNRMALIHNGIITGYGDKKTKSDTRDFIDKVLGNISWKMFKNPSFCELVGNAIGYSKLAILDKTGAHVIINEQKGIWDDGVWFSNTSYKVKKYTPNTTQDYNPWYKAKDKKEEDKQPTQKKITYEDDLYDDGWGISDFIMKCGDCGKEWYDRGTSWNIECPSCKSKNLYEVGYVYKGKEEKYNDPIPSNYKYAIN